METPRALIAIVLSLVILIGYQYFFVPAPTPPAKVAEQATNGESGPPAAPGRDIPATPPELSGSQAPASTTAPVRVGRDISVDTGLYRTVVSETGGTIKSFQLKEYKESLAPESPFKELVRTNVAEGLPLFFSWGVEPARAGMPFFTADQEKLRLEGDSGSKNLTLVSRLPNGLEVTKILTFHARDYRMEMVIDVHNTTGKALQGAPYLTLTNRPFSLQKRKSRYSFTGPAVYIDNALEEVKVGDLKKESAGKSFTGKVQWLSYEGTYFMCSVAPKDMGPATAHFSVSGEEKVTSVLAGAKNVIPPRGRKQYAYTVYFGPKKLSLLKTVGNNLDRAVNFGWFDVLARPTLYFLNFLYKYIHNYGVAIILLTILIKLLFWPISHKGMKSMKTMQKLQPKMAKLREKYKDDKERQQQEMMKLYQTYKVNPLGGCLPMVLQIPVFFALYKVLLQAIELRHAPFMLWITDLSAPDRLPLGFHVPMLGGLPVLTLLMGASMFLQQKMTPSTGDPTQAKIMMFLPIIFTFMFINFASGLVLYWLMTNLLTIAQQYVINKQVD